jgi:hypothetical protein
LKLRELLRQDRDFVGVLRGGRLDCQCSGDRDQDIGDCIEAVRRRRLKMSFPDAKTTFSMVTSALRPLLSVMWIVCPSAAVLKAGLDAVAGAVGSDGAPEGGT